SRDSRRRDRSRTGNLPDSRSPALRLSDHGKSHGSTQTESERDDLLAVEATGSVGQRRRFGIADPQSAAGLIADDGLLPPLGGVRFTILYRRARTSLRRSA